MTKEGNVEQNQIGLATKLFKTIIFSSWVEPDGNADHPLHASAGERHKCSHNQAQGKVQL